MIDILIGILYAHAMIGQIFRNIYEATGSDNGASGLEFCQRQFVKKSTDEDVKGIIENLIGFLGL